LSAIMKAQTAHWSAGTGREKFDDYGGCINCVLGSPDDGKWTRMHPDDFHLSAVWGRNSGNFSMAFLAELGASPAPDGHGGIKPVGSKFAVTPKAIETMAKAFAENCCFHNLDPDGFYEGPVYIRHDAEGPNDRLEPTGAMQPLKVCADHAYYAKIDQYPQDRFDIADIWEEVHPKMLWYIAEIKSGRQNYEHTRKGTYLKPGAEC